MTVAVWKSEWFYHFPWCSVKFKPSWKKPGRKKRGLLNMQIAQKKKKIQKQFFHKIIVIFNIPAQISPTTKKIEIFTDTKLIQKFHPYVPKELRCVTFEIMKYETTFKTSVKAIPHWTCWTYCSKLQFYNDIP